MTRYATPMTSADFAEKLRSHFEAYPDFISEYDLSLRMEQHVLDATATALHHGQSDGLFAEVFTDWAEIRYYPENTEFQMELPVSKGTDLYGLVTLPSGFTFLAGLAGGDSQQPLFLIVYHDGTEFRGYVPTQGNTFNHTTKAAFGINKAADTKALIKQYPDLVCVKGKTEAELAEFIKDEGMYDSVGKHLRLDKSAILADIEAQIVLSL